MCGRQVDGGTHWISSLAKHSPRSFAMVDNTDSRFAPRPACVVVVKPVASAYGSDSRGCATE